jgi:nuclear pore complex protein Nup133
MAVIVTADSKFSPTVTIGKVPTAYKLAERHRDFRALVELCTDVQHGSPARVRYFMGKYSRDFAFSLYQYYLERGECVSVVDAT